MTKIVTVGLFGTCGGSTWRNDFMTTYGEHGVEYFNPDAGDNWHPGMIEDENRHLREDEVILFPVLAETQGVGSLGEIGFSIQNVIRNINNGSNQFLIIMIDDECTDPNATPAEIKTSNRTRKLVKSKAQEVTHPNILVVNTLQEMMDASLDFIEIAAHVNNVRGKFANAG